MAYQPPRGTELIGSSDPFVIDDGGRWFVVQNHDYEDAEGNCGMCTEYLADPVGYSSATEAYAAMDKVWKEEGSE